MTCNHRRVFFLVAFICCVLTASLPAQPINVGFLWIGAFQTQDGGNLIPAVQVPGSNDGNLNLDANEWLRIELHTLRTGDFNRDGLFACDDVDALVAAIAEGVHELVFDLTGDGAVDTDDLMQWLASAGAAQLASGKAYLMGDANLDGTVDGSDFLAWNAHRFQSDVGWCGGDFDANNTVDGADFLLWNQNKFQTADGSVAVPEPLIGATVWGLLVGLWRRQLNRLQQSSIYFAQRHGPGARATF